MEEGGLWHRMQRDTAQATPTLRPSHWLCVTSPAGHYWGQLQDLFVHSPHQGAREHPWEVESLGTPRLSQITEIEPVSLLGGRCKVSFLMGRCCGSRWIGVNERTLKCSRPMPTVSSCPDSCMPCLMVGNYALAGLPEENND